jgi:hypothetical protein
VLFRSVVAAWASVLRPVVGLRWRGKHQQTAPEQHENSSDAHGR